MGVGDHKGLCVFLIRIRYRISVDRCVLHDRINDLSAIIILGQLEPLALPFSGLVQHDRTAYRGTICQKLYCDARRA